MASYAEIANSAATIVGTAARLTLPGEDTVLGRAVAAQWDLARRAVLRDGSFNFSIARASLPALAVAPTHGWERAFQLPADCLKLIEVYGWGRAAYQLEGTKILSDAGAPLEIRYVRDVTEPAEFDGLVAEAFAQKIANAIGNKIAGSAYKEELGEERYRRKIVAAKRADALENPPIAFEESGWILARHVGGPAVDLNYVDGGRYPGGWW